MDKTDNYKIANLIKEDVDLLTRLENQIKADTGKDVVLIAYEKKNNR